MPDGWLEDEPDMNPDPKAERPDDWDDDMDGDWEAPLIENPNCKDAPGCGTWNKPMIDNPKYKGKWVAPMINNPNYKGKWKPRRIANPDYFHDPEPFKMTSIGAVGIELWSMSNDIYFDNLLITSDMAVADSWAQDTYSLKIQKLDQNSANIFTRIVNYSNKNPWLYAVYVVVIGLPLVLIITFCCSGESKRPESDDPKKTDEMQEDDTQETDEGEDNDVDGEEEKNSDSNVNDTDNPPTDEDKAPRKRKARRE
jgi:calnexin